MKRCKIKEIDKEESRYRKEKKEKTKAIKKNNKIRRERRKDNI